jgi:hypothetical protein
MVGPYWSHAACVLSDREIVSSSDTVKKLRAAAVGLAVVANQGRVTSIRRERD